MMTDKILITELCILAVVLLHFYPLTGLPVVGEIAQASLRGILVFFVILYLPGYRSSWFFFDEDELTDFERFMCSFAMSLAYVIIASLYVRLAGGTVDTYQGIFLSCLAIAFWIGAVRLKNRLR